MQKSNRVKKSKLVKNYTEIRKDRNVVRQIKKECDKAE